MCYFVSGILAASVASLQFSVSVFPCVSVSLSLSLSLSPPFASKDVGIVSNRLFRKQTLFLTYGNLGWE